ncbi:MAG: hypothetical protein RIR54_280, partial [Actinomycetota bacterium]
AGCIVFSTKRGAAKYDKDMPLPDWYKFDRLEEVLENVASVVSARTTAFDQQTKYRAWVAENKSWFESEVRSLLARVE